MSKQPTSSHLREAAIPLAYLITYHTYGTWLHGDKRESMDRRFFNRVRAPKIPDDPNLERTERRLSRHGPVILSARMRTVVRNAIREVCRHRGYRLHALNVRTNHVHVVVSAVVSPEKVMNDFKSYSTRRLREAQLVDLGRKLWVRHGSTRYLWKSSHLAAAIQYVLFGQGDNVPNFDWTDGI